MPKTPVKTVTITIDEETKTIVEGVQSRLQTELGFKPTLSQTVRNIVKASAGAVE